MNKLDALRKRETKLREAIAREKVREQKAKARDDEREASIIGALLVDYAERVPDFKLMLKQVLASAPMEDGDRKFLSGRGWV